MKTPLGAVVGGVITIIVTVTATYLTTTMTGAAHTKLDQFSDAPWIRYSVLPMDSTQLGYVTSTDPKTATLSGGMPRPNVDVQSTMFKLQLTGLSRSGVRIYDGRIRVHRRSDPQPGVLYLPIGLQGDQDTIGLTADLDAQRPGLRDVDAPGQPLYFHRNDVTLTFGEHVELTMTARTDSSTVVWDVELELQRDGDAERDTVILDNGGRPWTTTAVSPDMRGYTAAYEEVTPKSWRRHDDVLAFCRTHERLRPHCGGRR